MLRKIIQRQLEEKPNSRIIVFAQYRDTGKRIVESLSGFARPVRFVGQVSFHEDKGLKQEEQEK